MRLVAGVALGEAPLGGRSDVDRAVAAARAAFESWRRVPPVERARYLFKFKGLLEDNFEELARIVTLENGKTLPESRGSVRRGIECVEVATGAPSLLMGQVLEDYSDDTPYPSRLILGWQGDRPLHVVAAYNAEDDETIVITAYEPDPDLWDAGFRVRKR